MVKNLDAYLSITVPTTIFQIFLRKWQVIVTFVVVKKILWKQGNWEEAIAINGKA